MNVHPRLATLILASAALATATAARAQAVSPTIAGFSAPLASSSSSSSSAILEEADSAAQATPASTHASGGGHAFSSLGVGVKIGLEGIGFDAATPIVPGTLNVRGGAGFFSYSTNFTTSNQTVNGTLKLNNAEIMADWFPFHGSFRLSGGLTVYNNTAVNGTLNFAAGTSFTMGNTKYISAPSPNSAAGVAAFKFGGNTVPRFTFGWGNMVPRSGHFKFETELGIEYIGNPALTYTITGQACTTSDGSTCSSAYGPVAPADIAQENAKIQNDLNGLKIFPVIQFGLSYKIGR